MSARGENLEKALRNIGARLVREARINLDKGRMKDRGRLRKSLGFEVEQDDQGFTVSLLAAKYAKYIDQGRGPSSGASGGDGDGQVRTSIEGWVRRNRYRLKGRRGQFGALKPYQIKSMAFYISQKIHNVGFVGIEFISDAFKTTEPYITNSVAASYKKDIMEAVEQILNDR